MKVLIVEDTSSKLETAVALLKKYSITEYEHVNNYYEAVRICFSMNRIDEFDVIILDLFFYLHRPLIGSNDLPNQNAGYMFLCKMAEKKHKKPVIIFSREEEYIEQFKKFLFPSFSDFCTQAKQTSPIFIPRTVNLEKSYKEEMEKSEKMLKFIDFIIGHARNEYELEELFVNFINLQN